jgi:hypothetical protein
MRHLAEVEKTTNLHLSAQTHALIAAPFSTLTEFSGSVRFHNHTKSRNMDRMRAQNWCVTRQQRYRKRVIAGAKPPPSPPRVYR